MECFDVPGVVGSTMKRKKILFFVSEDWYFCSHRLPVAKAARDKGFKVVVVTHVGEHADLITNEGFRLVPIDIERGRMNPLLELKLLFNLWNIYRKESPDIVHNVAMKPILWGTLAGRLTAVPVIINAFAGLGDLYINKELKVLLVRNVLNLLFKLSFRSSKVQTIFQNSDDSEYFKSKNIISESQISLIRGSGVDTDIYKPLPREKNHAAPVVIVVCRMLWTKGIDEFVKSAKILKSQGVNVRMVLVGDSDEKNPASISKKQLLEWHDSGCIEWWGRRDDIPEILNKSDIAVLPSYREGLPKSLVEAASSELPIIATDVPGCKEIVVNNDNGLLVNYKDVDSLVEALKILIHDAALRKKMGKRGREMVIAEFSQESVVNKTIQLYERLIGS